MHDKSLGRVVFNEDAYKGRVVVNTTFETKPPGVKHLLQTVLGRLGLPE